MLSATNDVPLNTISSESTAPLSKQNKWKGEWLQNITLKQTYKRTIKSRQMDNDSSEHLSAYMTTNLSFWIVGCYTDFLLLCIWSYFSPFNHFFKHESPHMKDGNKLMLEKDANTSFNPCMCSHYYSLHCDTTCIFYVVDHCLSTWS